MYMVNRSSPPDFRHEARAMRRPVLIYRHIRLGLEILFAVVALAVGGAARARRLEAALRTDGDERGTEPCVVM